MKHEHRHLLAILLFAPDALYATAWLVMDVSARLGIWPRDWAWVDIYGFVASYPISAEVIFFAVVPFKLAALVLMIARRKLAVPVLAIAAILHFADWMSLLGNPYYQASVDGILQILAEVTALALLVRLRMAGWLR